MKKITALLAAFFRQLIIAPIPQGQQGVDPTGNNGLTGLWSNVNNYAESLSSVATSGTAITLIAMGQTTGSGVAGNILAGFCVLNAGATGTLTATLPTTSSIISALGPSIPLDGSYSEPIHIMNNSGQTMSLAAGDSNTTIIGSTSTVTGNVRKLMLRVLNSSNISISNVGTWTF
jgi:hypothetical protein